MSSDAPDIAAPAVDAAAVLAQLADGVVVLGPRLVIRAINPAAARLLDCDATGCIGRTLPEVIDPADPLTAQLLLRELRSGARVREAALSLRVMSSRTDEDVGTRTLSLSAGPIAGASEPQMVLSLRDVTEQRRRDAALRRTRDFLERLVEASADAIVAADLSGRVLVFNRAAEQLFGLTSEVAIGQVPVGGLYPDDGARQVMRWLRESPDGRIEARRCEIRTISGERVPVELSAALLRVAGREEATVGLMRDLRERDRVESELARAREALLESERARAVTALAGAAAHELNQPLTVLSGTLVLLRRRVVDPAVLQRLEMLGGEVERMAEIVARLARITRVRTTSYPGASEILDLSASSQPALDDQTPV